MSSNSVCNHTRDKQIGHPLRGRPILLSLVWLQTELDSTQSYYHYLSPRVFVALSICRLRKFASMFEIVSNKGFLSRPCFQLVFHWVSKLIHLTRIRCSGWVRAAWIINDFEKCISVALVVPGARLYTSLALSRARVLCVHLVRSNCPGPWDWVSVKCGPDGGGWRMADRKMRMENCGW